MLTDIQKHLIHIVEAYCVLYMVCVEKCALLLQFTFNCVVSSSKRHKKKVNNSLVDLLMNHLLTDLIYLWDQSIHTAIDNISIDKMWLNSIEILVFIILFFSSSIDIWHFLRITSGPGCRIVSKFIRSIKILMWWKKTGFTVEYPIQIYIEIRIFVMQS